MSETVYNRRKGRCFTLSQRFDNLLVKIGNPNLKHPVFYNSPIGIRFEIGCETPISLDASVSDNRVADAKYIDAALQRAKAIYTALPHAPNLLRIDVSPREDELRYEGGLDMDIFQGLLPFPHEQKSKQMHDGDEQYPILQLYWDLNKMNFPPDLLLREIIRADFGGISSLTSSVFFANTEAVYLYHVYDDRGADLVAGSKETLRPFYHNLNQWILDYDRKQIDKLFAK